MATEKQLMAHSRLTAADLSTKQFYAVKLNSSEQIALCSTKGERAIGILQDKPGSGIAATVMVHGISKALVGTGGWTMLAPLTTAADGTVIIATDEDDAIMGFAFEAATAGDYARMLLTPGAGSSSLSAVETFTAAADYSSTGQYTAVKPNTVAGEVIKATVAGESVIGVLQNAPAAGASAQVATWGPATAKAGTGGVAAGDRLRVEVTTGKLVTAKDEEPAVGWALAAILADANGAVFLAPMQTADPDIVTLVASADYSATGQYLAMKVHTTAGQFVKATVRGEPILGILQNAPAASAAGKIATRGVCTATAGTAGVAAGDDLTVEVTTGKLITAQDGDLVVGYALAAILADATGLVYLEPNFRQKSFYWKTFTIADLTDISGAGDVISGWVPGHHGRIEAIECFATKPVTTGGKAATLNCEIGTTNLTGGEVALTSANLTPLGARVAGSAITGNNIFTPTDAISIEAASVTAFDEGSIDICLKISNS